VLAKPVVCPHALSRKFFDSLFFRSCVYLDNVVTMNPNWIGTAVCGSCGGSGRGFALGSIERDLGNYLKRAGKSMRWLAEEIGVTPGHLSRMINGKKPWQVKHLQKIFGVVFPNRTTESFD
jgi:hypothetical protein